MPIEVYAVLLGVFVGGFVGYYFSIKLATKQQSLVAAANLRAAFAPALAQFRISANRMIDNPISGSVYVETYVLQHASAIEEFRPFVCDSVAYQEAWDHYYQLATGPSQNLVEERAANLPQGGVITNAINDILHFAKT